MATLVVIGYADQAVAEDARKSVQELEDELTIQADGVASIARDVQGRYHTHVSHSGAPAGGCADWGVFWSYLFDLVFFISTAGLGPGGGSGAPPGHLSEPGVDKRFQDQVRHQVRPGTSAVFIMIEHAPLERIVGALAHYGGTTIATTFSDAEIKHLEEVLTGWRSQGAARVDQ